jgi:hypothetical protein
MGVLGKLTLFVRPWLTAATHLVGGLPHSTRRCPDGRLIRPSVGGTPHTLTRPAWRLGRV